MPVFLWDAYLFRPRSASILNAQQPFYGTAAQAACPKIRVPPMATRNEFDDHQWVSARRQSPPKPSDDSDPSAVEPTLKETILDLALTLGGIVGVVLLLFASLHLLGE